MKKAIIKLLIFIPAFVCLAVFPFQSGFCCQQEGATCQNHPDHPDQVCCSNDTEFECWDELTNKRAEDDTIGVCRVKKNSDDSED